MGFAYGENLHYTFFKKLASPRGVIFILICRIGDCDFEIFSTSYANRCSLMGFQLQNLQCEFSTQGQPRFRTKTLENQDMYMQNTFLYSFFSFSVFGLFSFRGFFISDFSKN